MKKTLYFIISLFLSFYVVIFPSFAFSPSDDTLISGIDVSSWQQDIDFTQVSSSGVEIVYIKASEGTNFIDPYFETNYKKAKSAGLKVGFYHYVTSRSVENAIEQADFFANTIAGKEPDCRLAMDFETFGSLSRYEINQISLAFLQELEKKSGKDVVLYSNTYTAETIFDSTVSNYPLWVAEYFVSSPGNNGNWSTWIGWQYTDKGEISGINSYVDLDKFTEDIFLDDTSPIPDNNSNKKPSESYKTITIAWGDTLSEIALEYGTTVKRLVELNNIANPNLIYAGNTLLIPIGDDSSLSAFQTAPYIVKPGDTLSKIAKDNNTTISALVSINNIKNTNLIFVGQILNIPTLHCDMSHSLYVVKRGDTLWGISRRFGVSIADIVMLNRISNPNLIYPGNVLRI